MKWLENLLPKPVQLAPEPFPEPETPVPSFAVTALQRSRVSYHVERFRRALLQCTNPAKRPELEKWLSYYEKLEALETERMM